MVGLGAYPYRVCNSDKAVVQDAYGRKVGRAHRGSSADPIRVAQLWAAAPALLAERDLARAEAAYWKGEAETARSVALNAALAELEEAKRALQAICELPIQEQDNMLSANMRQLALSSAKEGE